MLQCYNVANSKLKWDHELCEIAVDDGQPAVQFFAIEHFLVPAYTVFEPKGGGGGTGMVGTKSRRAMKG